jgi:phenylpropionate dioxygenase-like ring-hydroxylating dioxygenase large terminal subunit
MTMTSATSAGHRCPIPVEEFETSVGDLHNALTLPPECYTSAAFWEFEKEAIFFHEWLCLGRADQIPNPGDYFTITIANEPLIVVRDQGGDISVLSAVCRHRGTVIADDAGNCGHALRCPYHWWTYDLQGNLIGAPGMDESTGFDKRDVQLPRLHVALWQGFVFASFDADPVPLGPRLTKVEPFLANYHLDQLVTTAPEVRADLPFNWKIMLDNGTEPYHAPYLHHKYVPMPPPGTRGKFLDCSDDDGVMASIVELGAPDLGINQSGALFLPPIGTLNAADRRRWVFATVPPNLMFFWEADFVSWFLLVPNRPDAVTLLWGYCVSRATRDDPAFEDRIELVRAGIETFNREDFRVNARIQQGYNSRFAQRGRYGPQEEILLQLNRWLVGRYQMQAERTSAAISRDA